MKAMIPSYPEVLREALIVCLGALIATALVRSLPDKYQSYFKFNQ